MFWVLNGSGGVPGGVRKGVGREGSIARGRGRRAWKRRVKTREARTSACVIEGADPQRKGSWEEGCPCRTELTSKLPLGAGRRRVPKGRSYAAVFIMGGASGEKLTERAGHCEGAGLKRTFYRGGA